MLSKNEKNEIKRMCDDYTLEGLYNLINNGTYEDNEEKQDFITSIYQKRIEKLENILPEYVTNKNYDKHRLTQYLCKKGCNGQNRWLEFQQPVLKISDIQDSQLGDYKAKCLYCGSILDYGFNMTNCP